MSTKEEPQRDLIAEARKLLSKATPGRWQWVINVSAKQVGLESQDGPRQYVIDFTRWGMNGATPRFQVDGLMQDAQDCAAVVEGREHHAAWYQTLDHPDANLIARSPDLLSSLCSALEEQQELNRVQAESIRSFQAQEKVMRAAIEKAIPYVNEVRAYASTRRQGHAEKVIQQLKDAIGR